MTETTQRTPEELMALAEMDSRIAAGIEDRPLTQHYDSVHDSAERNYQLTQIVPEADPIVDARIPTGGGTYAVVKLNRQEAINNGWDIIGNDPIQPSQTPTPEDTPKPIQQAKPKVSPEQVSALSQLALEERLTPEVIEREAARAGVSNEEMQSMISTQRDVTKGKLIYNLNSYGMQGEQVMEALNKRSPDEFKEAVMLIQEGESNGMMMLQRMALNLQEENIANIYRNADMFVSTMQKQGADIKIEGNDIITYVDDLGAWVSLSWAVRNDHVAVEII